MRDGVAGRQVGAVEEQLPGERRAVERPGAENGHRRIPWLVQWPFDRVGRAVIALSPRRVGRPVGRVLRVFIGPGRRACGG
ncbi:hypothetical protein Skr01_43180 [Sphaerisporangium krabiense]|nr:hypothetical protein Skr01_43180 [Sphaerisporangium krabiense]